MEVAMPTMSGNAIDCYEDMFKEITRKLYGEDGLPDLPQTDRNHQAAQDRGLTPIDYDVDTPILKPEEHLTAFGLAALMQNGFPSPFQQHKPNPNFEDKWIISEDNIPWTQSKIASYNPAQKLFRCAECDCVGYLPRVAEHWLGTHSNLRVFQCPQCPYESAWARCVRMHLTRQHNINTEEATDALLKNNPVLQEVTRFLQRLKTRLESSCSKPPAANIDDFQNINANRQVQQTITNQQETPNASGSKRYSCSYCPYATDRRDLFTRHENIHREEKPFQCYVCQKQFNRADHVKKHFLRMHREHVYDLNRIRRHPPKNASGMSYYQKYNNNTTEEQPEANINNCINNAITIPNGFNNISRTLPNNRNNVEMKPKSSKVGSKKKGEKRFSCCYCSWSGVDNWCLKRHMNTHLKPFVCGLCDYKAARSERLATHVLKVHNKRACSKCTFLADDQQQLTAHQQEQHPLEQRNNRTSSAASNVLRNTSFANTAVTSSGINFGQSQPPLKNSDITAAAALLQGNRLLQPVESKQWKPHIPKQHGAARLFNYMEASDGSDPDCDSSCGAEDMSRLSHRVQSDFLEAGDVGSCTPDEETGEMELPLFVCQTCGCEFEDDGSLETHQLTHKSSTTSPAKKQKENVNPRHRYQCKYCSMTFTSQVAVIGHMTGHSTLNQEARRSRKQMLPKRISNGNTKKPTIKSKASKKLYYCFKCKGKSIHRFNSESNLILHNYWMHSKKNEFPCEHCELKFEHRYQMILHSSKEHVEKKTKDTAPVAAEDPHFMHTNLALPAAPAVPDITNASASVHKLGMYFDHSFNTGLNGHMPLIIPTFPPN
ncbi:PREDICTED: zinc finger protein 84-like [Nicrophorus vespilloides]|uniref:Zinc finger protein 84-like n=1 Tax=Nicrophorus vespilloides TaxID=110193 RepID=A0ABM1NAI3_NICVS|nr:PREDICTED: zinc finger protein 84-like [Nicrophorus vespilloides]XP_017783832.1 PREDICTED: zinc finger protein 84-like [Nicrophorus vespilloides]XP_017783833.1 PREDICTED: zinc finger protein 84-like [Nicrophorus vespilloides]XP_017783834.1 PREDICTED: zinc finger protein 84-like [Nicrophorus vespilloides]XP_017783835.1 PREDICTED: zinc finger protein 84-like [Nicrophorus vespilloides]